MKIAARKFCFYFNSRILRPFSGTVSMGFRMRRLGARASILIVSVSGVLIISAEVIRISAAIQEHKPETHGRIRLHARPIS